MVAQVNGMVTRHLAMIPCPNIFLPMIVLTLAAVPVAQRLRNPATARVARPNPYRDAAALE